MNSLWKYESSSDPTENLAKLVDELKRFNDNPSSALQLGALLADVQRFNGWEHPLLRCAGYALVTSFINQPELLHAIYSCDTRLLEGKGAEMLWSFALQKNDLETSAIDNLLLNYERPAKLGAASFDWFVTNNSEWPRDLLVRHGVNLEAEAPPQPRFLEKLLTYKIPAIARVREPKPTRGALFAHGLGVIYFAPVVVIFASIAQVVMSARFDIDAHLAASVPVSRHKGMSPAAKHHFRTRVIIEIIVDLWGHSLKSEDDDEEDEEDDPFLMLDIEEAILQDLPEIREDERFLWALDECVYYNFPAQDVEKAMGSFERLRGVSVEETPITLRDSMCGVPYWDLIDGEN